MLFRRCFFVAIVLSLVCLRPTLAYDQPTRVTTYVASAQNVLDDLEYMVSELAGEPKIWEDKVYPNIDIFLIGLDPALPIRFDSLLDPATGTRSLLMVPLAGGDAREFLRDNLDPIGIFNTPKQQMGRPPRAIYWQLESDPAAPIFDGWMRSANGYAYIAKVEDDIPATIEPPDASHAHLAATGADLAIQLLNPQPGETDRAAAFAKYKDNIISALEPYDDETDAEFGLRSLVVHQQFERLEVMFMQTSDMSAKWTLADGQGQLDVTVAPLPNTQLAADFNGSVGRVSHFARVPSSEDSVLSGRLHMLLSETLRRQFSEFYVQAIPVIQSQIDTKEGYNDGERQARKDAIAIILQMLADNAADGDPDAYIELTPAAGGLHTMVTGLTFRNTDRISELLNAITGFGAGWSLEENVANVGNVTVHKLHCGDSHPVALTEFFGPANDYYVGVDGKHVWVASGADAMDSLTTAIGQVTDESLEPGHTPLFSVDFQVRPILHTAHAWEQESAIDLMAFFKKGGFANQTRERQNARSEDGEEPLMASFKDFNWQQIIVDTLEGTDARIRTRFDLDAEGNLQGQSIIETEVLKAAGRVIAEFADEQL